MILDRERLTNYPRIFVTLYVVLGGWWVLSGPGLLDRSGKPVGVDFVTFYAASMLAQAGDVTGPWSVERIHAAERAAVAAEIPPYAFHYPPTFLLLLLPLAGLPYLAALFGWWASATAAYLTMVRRVAPGAIATGLALAFPGWFQNIIQGQNGCFTAALVGGGLALVDSRPAVAGALFGVLTYKPQLTPVIAVALLAGRRWRALGSFVVTTVLFAGAATLAFGLEPWRAFLANASFAVRVLETPDVLPWFRMPTVQVAAMLLGVPVVVARVLQGVAALAAVATVAWVWGKGGPPEARAMAATAGLVLSTPFAFDYDLAVLAVPVVFLGARVASGDQRPGELALLIAAFVAPLALPGIAEYTHLSLGPVLCVALLAAAVRRTA